MLNFSQIWTSLPNDAYRPMLINHTECTVSKKAEEKLHFFVGKICREPRKLTIFFYGLKCKMIFFFSKKDGLPTFIPSMFIKSLILI